MEFKKYPSLTNHYQSKFTQKVMSLYNGQWQAFEKLHGANFSIHIENKVVKFARRNAFLEPDESFFGYQEVMNKYAINDLAVYLGSAIVYGELYGDGIQKEIQYGDKEFRVFDIELAGKMLPQHAVKAVCDIFAIPYVSAVFKGSLIECLALNPVFNSEYVNKGDEQEAEGYVFKPTGELTLPCGSVPYIKMKSERFLEKKGAPKVKPKIDLQGLTDALAYVNLNRVDAVMSKLGELTLKDLPLLAEQVYQDAEDDMKKDEVEFDQVIMKRVKTACYIESKKRL